MPDLLERYTPQAIQSKADPDPELLLDGRAAVMSNQELRRLLQEGRQSGRDRRELSDALILHLVEHWKGEVGTYSCLEVATYLVDEYLTLGEGIFLVNRTTGKIEATLAEEDLYRPAPVPREDGGLAQPGVQIRPDVQSAIAVWLHDREREKAILAELKRRASLTPLLEEEGDRRLQIATRRGRAQIVAEVAQSSPAALLMGLSGSLGAFMRRFPVINEAPEDLALRSVQADTFAQTKRGVQDQLTINLSYSPQAHFRSALPAAWLRQTITLLAQHAHAGPKLPGAPPPLPLLALTREHLGEADLWIVDPNLLHSFRSLNPRLTLITIEGVSPLGILPGEVGCLQVPEAFEPVSREMFDRWQVEARLQTTIWYDPDRIALLDVCDVPLQAQVL